MRKFETLVKFENFYDAIKPAQEKSKEAFAWFSDIPHPLFNAVMHLKCHDNVRTKVDALIKQAPANIAMSFWIHPGNQADGLVELLKDRGFNSTITCPLMAWDVIPVSTPEYDIRPANMDEFHEIISVVYAFNDEVKKGFQKLMENVEGENYILYINEKPIATATLLVNGTIGGIFNDANLPERREAGTAMMQFLMHRSSELNLNQIVLLSSPEGTGLYESLGFKKIYNIDIFCR